MEIRCFNKDSPVSSFGCYLKAIRETQGISLDSVAEKICVSPRVLSRIESEDHARMPEEVYVRGILRSYAEVVGVDPEDIKERYQIHRSAHEQKLLQKDKTPASGRKVLYRMILALAVLAVITPAFLYVSTLPYESRSDQAAVLKTKGPDKEEEMNFYPARLGDIAHAAVGKSASIKQASEAERQILSIDVLSSVTVNISVDGREYTKYRLDPNDHLELAGESRFHILISDAEGVELCFNGEPVKIKADPGHSADITLP